MDEERLIKLMNENGFTKKEIGKLLLTAEKYPATLEWVVREFARHFKNVIFSCLICSAVLFSIVISIDHSSISKLMILVVYFLMLYFLFKTTAMNCIIKCYKFMQVVNRKYKEAEDSNADLSSLKDVGNMGNSDIILLMRRNRFSDKQIAIIESVSFKGHQPIEIIIMQLSKRFTILSFLFTTLAILAVSLPILNGDENPAKITIVMFAGLVLLMKLLALDLCYKARRVARKIDW
ncbi:hypothetical protein RHD99_01020 [Buttiauxella selenatireducens]|uniref:Uncharacterized protein n=1 Tax=Buttiauxella selenatireducens TaxID=3073902 RepID=A0ABY9SAQ5_9ENTR|nr:hypothetical protein [Buttiauxella sp. R73]WMY74598.1 hypothetical protein RHD99_01020 [Buttiauxella sp. R73]